MFPGRDFIHTLNLVCRVVGTPSAADAAAMPGGGDAMRRFLAAMPREERADLATFFPGADPQAIDLLEKLLVFK